MRSTLTVFTEALQRGQRTACSTVYSASYWMPSGSGSLSAALTGGGTLGAGFIATGMWVPQREGVKPRVRQSFDALLLESLPPLFASDFEPLFSEEEPLSAEPLSPDSALSLPGF